MVPCLGGPSPPTPSASSRTAHAMQGEGQYVRTWGCPLGSCQREGLGASEQEGGMHRDVLGDARGRGGDRPHRLRHRGRGSRQQNRHFLSSLVPVYIQGSCFREAFSTDFDGLSGETQANFTKAVGLPGTHSKVIRRFWHGCNYRSLDVAQERMR